jgi:glutamate/aspartate transport system substrate-binding protein
MRVHCELWPNRSLSPSGSMRRGIVAGIIIAVLALGSASAQDMVGTLKKVRDTGVLTIGHRESSIPFSYYDGSGAAVGYAIDLCSAIADKVKAALGLARLEVKLLPVTSANRIPLLADGTTDLECGSTTNNLEREKVVAFSVTTFITSNRFVAKARSNLRTLEDLRGKTVVSTIGTTNLNEISDLNTRRGLSLSIIAAKDHVGAFRMVESGRAAAFVMDEILLHSLVANSPAPMEYSISDDRLSLEPYGIMLRRYDSAFKHLVDDTLLTIYRRGEIYSLYSKWFMAPIPPNGVDLNIPMSPSLKHIIEHPTDSGDPAIYAAAEPSD